MYGEDRVYKKVELIGTSKTSYKTAKRRFSIELEDIRFEEMRIMTSKIINPITVFR